MISAEPRAFAMAVMARAPVAGRCKTRLLGAHPAEWVAALARAMLEDTLERLGEMPASCRVVLVAPILDEDARELVAPLVPAGWSIGLQKGDDLGARLAHATTRILEDAPAPSRAIIVGTDCPHFPDFADANADVLLGPTDDGGYWLIAPRVPETGIYRDIQWSTPTVLDETLARCRELALSVHLLPRTFDVDEPADVVRLAALLATAPEIAPRTARVLQTK